MTPIELYSRIPERVDGDISILIGSYYNHIPEADAVDHFNIQLEKNTRIEIRYYKDFDFDGRRFWRLASVWFDDKPTMIIQNAGREGDDHSQRFITDYEHYSQMITYIITSCITIQPSSQKDNKDVVDPDQPLAGLTEFYGNELDGPFERYQYR